MLLDIMTMDLDAFDALVRARRTSLVVDQVKPVPTELVERLCELALWAPNHKRTWPWRFALVTGEARGRLGEAFCADQVLDGKSPDHPKVIKTRTKFNRSPAVLVVGSAADHSPDLHIENRDAVSSGVQNILLGATAAGLASFWSSPSALHCPNALAFCGFEEDTQIVGSIYLGWPSGEVPVPERPGTGLRHITE
jgi:nitroreductase